jgi:hypothetical protein
MNQSIFVYLLVIPMLGGPAFLTAMGTQFQTLKTMEAMVTKVVVSECLADSSFNIADTLYPLPIEKTLED